VLGSPALPDPARPFTVLCLDGGGTAVLASARALAHLENELGWPLRRRFDLLAGTSAGGILALAIAAAIPLHAFANAWAHSLPNIFAASSAPKGMAATLVGLARSLLRPRHDGTGLRQWLAHPFPDGLLVGDLPARVLVPATDLTEGRARVLRTHHAPGRRHVAHWEVRDLALATTAAPIFLPVHRAHGHAWADGGLFANSPNTLALMEAIGPLQVPVDKIHMLSVGGNWRITQVPGQGPPLAWGAREWATGQRIVKTVMQSQQGVAIETAMRVLGNRHHRWEAMPTTKEALELGLDSSDPIAITALERMGIALWEQVRHDPIVDLLSNHVAPKPTLGQITAWQRAQMGMREQGDTDPT
jgi:predicted acylesterase/phospholipase RssA